MDVDQCSNAISSVFFVSLPLSFSFSHSISFLIVYFYYWSGFSQLLIASLNFILISFVLIFVFALFGKKSLISVQNDDWSVRLNRRKGFFNTKSICELFQWYVCVYLTNSNKVQFGRFIFSSDCSNDLPLQRNLILLRWAIII